MPTAPNSILSREFLLSQKPIILWIHDPGAIYNHDAVVNPDMFPNFNDGQLLRIHCPHNSQQTQQQTQNNKQDQQDQKKVHDPQKQSQQTQKQQQMDQFEQPQHSSDEHAEHGLNQNFDFIIVKGHAVDRESLAKQQQLQLSISKDIADRFNLRSRQEVYVELITNPYQVALDHVELAFKEQYLGRSDMWRLQQSLSGTCVYHEKKILFAGSIKATIKRLFANDEQVTSGYITPATRMIFRSASAKYFLFIQMSREMWEFDEDGELYFEKAISNFLPHLFSRWKEEGTNHVVSIVLFTRVFYETKIDDPLINQSSDGRYYKDFYKVLADWETTDDWMSVIGLLKKEQLNFQPDVLLRYENQRQVVSGQISMAYEGNVLEAVNLALNPFDKHFVDRDLMRTGLSIILITPGVGKFFVNKKLLRLTNERMTDNGIAMDLVCLSPLPLHITPLMCYMDAPLTFDIEAMASNADIMAPRGGLGKPPIYPGNSPEKAALYINSNQKIGYIDPLYRDSNDAPTQKYYAVPHWIDCSFYHHETGRFLKQDKFKTRCKMYELQMMGIMEHDIRGISIPYLTEDSIVENNNTKEASQVRTIRQQRSCGSLSDKSRLCDENKSSSYVKNGETYLSRSANLSSSVRRTSFFGITEITPTQPQKNNSSLLEKALRSYDNYDSMLFKTSPEPRFNKRITPGPTSTSAKSTKIPHSSKNSFDIPDTSNNNDLWQNTNARYKATTTWHHTGDQRRYPSILSHSQQTGGKGPFDSHPLPPRKEDKNILDPFKASPTFNGRDDNNGKIRPFRRGTVNSSEVKYTSTVTGTSNQQPQQQHQQQQRYLQISNQPNNDEEEFTVVSSSTVDPVPINNKGSGSRSDSGRKALNHSPRQGIASGSLPSIHKQSGNSDIMRTSFGTNVVNNLNRSSPSYNSNRHNPYKNTLINPCNPSDNQNLFTSHLRRWQHALPTVKECDGPKVHWKSLTTPACLPLTTDYFPSHEELTFRYNHYMYTVSASEDTNLYQAGDRNLSEHKKTENLLIEMLSQRLAQGFQIIVDNTGSSNYAKPALMKGDGLISALNNLNKNKDNFGTPTAANTNVGKESENNNITMTRASGSPTNNNNNTTNTVGVTGNTKLAPFGSNVAVPIVGKGALDDNEKIAWKHMVWWLSMGHQVHQLTFDSSGQNVEVRRYVRMIEFDVSKVNYKCAIWPKNMITYRPKNVAFSYPSLMYQWNYLDHLVAGYQEELTDNLRFWRARFIVIPRETLPTNIILTGALHDNLDEEEKRIALFETWIQNIRKAKWLTPEEKEELQKRRKKEIGFSDLGIKLTTMDPSAYVASDAMGTSMTSPVESKSHSNILSSIITGQLLTRDSKSKDIAIAMQDPKGGVKIMDRRWHFRMYYDVFTGTELVDWLINQIEDITTREQAVQFGNLLMQRRPPLFHSATNRHSFLDGNYFYTLHDEFAVKKQTKASYRKVFGSSDSAVTAISVKEKDNTSNDINSLRQIPSTTSNTSIKRIEFQMSKSMIIDIDPYKKSDRRETAILHYDTIHNPRNCYHFQLNWLGCTAQLVQELLQNWSRQAERCGLKLVEGSVDQAYEDLENNNPFQCPVPISMVVPPPPVDELIIKTKIDIPAQFYEIALVRHLGFVLDVESDYNFDRAKSEGVDLSYSYIKEVYKFDQYIHQSGVSFVQIRPEGKGFYWVNNRLYTNHTPALIANRRQPSSQQFCHPDVFRTKFQNHCNDTKWLSDFWETTRTNFLKGITPDSSDAWVFENSGAVVETNLYRPVINTNITENTNDTASAIVSPANEKGLNISPSGNISSASTLVEAPIVQGTTAHSQHNNITVTISTASPSLYDPQLVNLANNNTTSTSNSSLNSPESHNI
ncbi:uncharacterized protein BX663DRAFT_494494 [Cokeromyces recurvatus]|uniref:uncharacterized protein n=1 Tax=Cokeromyces recurvatus TaxID=90255 RepID=UPI00222126FA|nr:uncharacterized protein BX663DRAFT_494494 [Cokeromyces recurvatus]KAI7907009.1 hypothetical protein BX663DRAFT_494494 [Cokeromyces recurvatus]